MKRVIDEAVTMHAEEVVLSVPDGRKITILINSTPIHSDDGAVESMIVTMQDLAPFQELNRLRAEFLGMVSHELRAPLAAIKGSAATVLGASRVLDHTEMQQFFRIIEVQADHMDNLISDLLDAGRIDSGMLSVDLQAGACVWTGGAGPDYLPKWWRQSDHPRRPAAGLAPCDGRRTSHRSGTKTTSSPTHPCMLRSLRSSMSVRCVMASTSPFR